MGQTPAKMFGPPVPYGSSPDSNVLMQAQAAPLAPQQTFLPLNPQQPAQSQGNPILASTRPATVNRNGQLGLNRFMSLNL